MRSTWGIYGEHVAGRLDLYKTGQYNYELEQPQDLLGHLGRELEPFLYANSAWSIHLVAWAGATSVPEKLVAPRLLLEGQLRGDTHVEIKLRDKGPVAPKTVNITGAAGATTGPADAELFERWRDCNQLLREIRELIPEDYVEGLGAKEVHIFHQIRALLHAPRAGHCVSCTCSGVIPGR